MNAYEIRELRRNRIHGLLGQLALIREDRGDVESVAATCGVHFLCKIDDPIAQALEFVMWALADLRRMVVLREFDAYSARTRAE